MQPRSCQPADARGATAKLGLGLRLRCRVPRPGRAAGQRGQILLEAAIVLPMMVFVVLGALQIMLLAHGRIMTEYAAYSAARAGIVHNADWNVMRNAAMISALPLYHRTDTLGHFLAGWAKVKAASEATEAVDMSLGSVERLFSELTGVGVSGIFPDISLVEVRVTEPDAAAFAKAREHYRAMSRQAVQNIDPKGVLEYPRAGQEVDFDDLTLLEKFPDLARLGVEVRVLVPLQIPVVNRLIFELWLAQLMLAGAELESDLQDWAQWRARVNGKPLDEAIGERMGDNVLEDMAAITQWRREVGMLRRFAEETGIYLLPVKASYAMRMQSNFFESNRREPVWFDGL